MPELAQPTDDGLYIPTVGKWSSDKHYYLSRYMDAFTTSMRGKWAGLNYIDLFAGAGIERIEESEVLEWGSPLLAARTRFPFSRLHLCEKSRVRYKALAARVSQVRPNAQILRGDGNERIDEIVREVPKDSLSLAFLDPFGLHLEFETLRKLSDIRADMIIFFPDHLDALRNWEKYYLQDPNSNLDRCLGEGADWRSILDTTPQDRLAEVLRNLYVDQIRSLGYFEFEYQRITMKGHPLYTLIFCSRSDFAAKLWRSISIKESDNQRRLPF
ncbi:MAG: three-Cys-motif partner protein TcmP [Planctomycetes bacterium]|jgi:three-Cys-motif partner protein|nr:three-Cys-motif partner protein TcmP [Planctomycetota bacterium]